MPPGAPYGSFILPYRIRVDDFTHSTCLPENGPPLLHLLTHTHSDHITGLSSKSFGYKVICSRDAKEMLLRHEVYSERHLHQLELRAEPTRTFSHLKVDPLRFPDGTMYHVGSRDLLEVLPLQTPVRFELANSESVTITSFDANHCPGAVMYLVEGFHGAVLHTGDFRAEPWFLESLMRNPYLQPYLAPREGPIKGGGVKLTKTLEAIYLDTANVLSSISVPTKERATSGLIELMKLFPDTCYFFINSWTWGYEDILKNISREFCSPIHVDRYKHSVYTHISDPFLCSVVTQDPASTRFHACERSQRCEYIAVDDRWSSLQFDYNPTSHMGKRVVYVNPVSMGVQTWELYIQETKETLARGEGVNNLLVPLMRHSPLPELRDFVSLFKPRRVIPNTLDSHLHGLDWLAINRMFADCLHPGVTPEASPILDVDQVNSYSGPSKDDDVAMKNLVGDGAADLAARWAESGRVQRKVDFLRQYLNPQENEVVNRILGAAAPPSGVQSQDRIVPDGRRSSGMTAHTKSKQRAVVVDSEDESNVWDSEDDARARTAHLLFADMAGAKEIKEHQWWVEDEEVDAQDGKEPGQQKEIDSSTMGSVEQRLSGVVRLHTNVDVLSSPIMTPMKLIPSIHPAFSPSISQHLGPSSTPDRVRAPTSARSQKRERPSLVLDSLSQQRVTAGHDLGSPFDLQLPSSAQERQTISDFAMDMKRSIMILSSPSFPRKPGNDSISNDHIALGTVSYQPSTSFFLESAADRKTTTESSIQKSHPSYSNIGAGPVNPVPVTPLTMEKDSSIVILRSKTSRVSYSPPLVDMDVNHDLPMMKGGSLKGIGMSIGIHSNFVARAQYDENQATPESSPPQHSRRNSVLRGKGKNTRPSRSNVKQSSQRTKAALSSPPTARGPGIDLTRIFRSGRKHADRKRKREGPQEQGHSEIEHPTAKRLRIAEGLARARPDLVVATYERKRLQLLSRVGRTCEIQTGNGGTHEGDESRRSVRLELERDADLCHFQTVDDGDGGMDWNRSHVLAEAVRDDVKNGRRPTLPMLLCTESQEFEYT